MPDLLQTLNREYGVSIARNYHPAYGDWPLVMVHSPGMAYAFDSHNIGLDSPLAAVEMLTAHGLHEVTDPFAPAPDCDEWTVLLDRDGEDPRDSELRGPHPIAPIGPLTRSGHVEWYWRGPAADRGWRCQLLFVSGVDFADLTSDQIPGALVTAASEHRVAGATIRVLP